jgi:hypothetical protein
MTNLTHNQKYLAKCGLGMAVFVAVMLFAPSLGITGGIKLVLAAVPGFLIMWFLWHGVWTLGPTDENLFLDKLNRWMFWPGAALMLMLLYAIGEFAPH